MRAKERAILVGPAKAIGFATRRVLDRQRYTQLDERLRRAAACDESAGEKQRRRRAAFFVTPDI